MSLSRRAHRWLIALGVLAALALAGFLLVGWLLQPDRLSAFLLDRIGRELGLELRATGPADYALRPEPRLLLAGLQARAPGAAGPLLVTGRIELSLPWSTLRGRTPEITRVQIDAPQLDLEALYAWLDTRPPADAPTPLPELTGGLRLRGGRIVAEGWTLAALSVDIDALRPARPTRLVASTRAQGEGFDVPLELELTGVAAGSLDDIRIDLAATHLRAGLPDAADPTRIALADGELRIASVLTLTTPDLSVSGPDPVPELSGPATLRYADQILGFEHRGMLPDWPDAWPPLPAPFGDVPAPWTFIASYEGGAGLDAPLRLQAQREGLRFDGRARVFELMAWLEASAASPLPPLEGELEAETMVVEGVRLEGIRLQLTAPAAADDEDEPPRP